MLTISYAERVSPSGLAPPDIGWSGTIGDFVEDPVFGLVSGNPTRTAILQLLYTNVACEPSELRFEHGGDRRGWAGDGFGIDPRRGEQPLGSTLWLLRREKLDPIIARKAEVEAVRALQPLVRQQIATDVRATGVIAGASDRLELTIDLAAKDGRPVFSDRFDVLWKAVA